MNRYENARLVISEHAHKQYCQRVEQIEAAELSERCLEQLKAGEYDTNQEWYLHLAGVWWIYDQHGDTVTFITCYGRMNIDLPAALKWATRFKDRIDLKHMV